MKVIKNNLVQNQSFLDVGVALRLSGWSYFGVYGALQHNVGPKNRQSGLGDPSLAGRLTLLRRPKQPLTPLVQLLFSYKPSLALDRDQSNTRDLADVFGSGFHDFSLGYDVWNDKNLIQFGLSQSVSFGLDETKDGINVSPATKILSSATFGYALSQSLRILTGYNHAYDHYRFEDGQKIESSRAIQHSLFLTADYKATKADNFKLSVSHGGILNSFNSVRNTTISLAYLKAWSI